MEQNLEGLGVGGEDDEFRDAAVQRLRGFVRALLQLLVVLCDAERSRVARERREGRHVGQRDCEAKGAKTSVHAIAFTDISYCVSVRHAVYIRHENPKKRRLESYAPPLAGQCPGW